MNKSKRQHNSKTNNSRRANVSRTIRNGTLIMTRDEYFENNDGYRKKEYLNNNTLYRDAFVIDSNRLDEIAVFKARSGGNLRVKNKSGQLESYSLHIKTRDNEGKPIKIGPKFQIGPDKFSISEHDANKIRVNAMKYSSNKILILELKHRGKKREIKISLGTVE